MYYVSTQPSPILFYFCTFAGINKTKNICIPRFSKILSKKYLSGTNFSSFLDLRVILSITAQSIFPIEPSAWARWKDILIENITKIKNKKSKNNNFFFTWGH
jgi:hypothetical protein